MGFAGSAHNELVVGNSLALWKRCGRIVSLSGQYQRNDLPMFLAEERRHVVANQNDRSDSVSAFYE
jgi:hypothetical protein